MGGVGFKQNLLLLVFVIQTCIMLSIRYSKLLCTPLDKHVTECLPYDYQYKYLINNRSE